MHCKSSNNQTYYVLMLCLDVRNKAGVRHLQVVADTLQFAYKAKQGLSRPAFHY